MRMLIISKFPLECMTFSIRVVSFYADHLVVCSFGITWLAAQSVLMATASTAYQAPCAIGECAYNRQAISRSAWYVKNLTILMISRIQTLINAGNVKRARLAVAAAAVITAGVLFIMWYVLSIS